MKRTLLFYLLVSVNLSMLSTRAMKNEELELDLSEADTPIIVSNRLPNIYASFLGCMSDELRREEKNSSLNTLKSIDEFLDSKIQTSDFFKKLTDKRINYYQTQRNGAIITDEDRHKGLSDVFYFASINIFQAPKQEEVAPWVNGLFREMIDNAKLITISSYYNEELLGTTSFYVFPIKKFDQFSVSPQALRNVIVKGTEPKEKKLLLFFLSNYTRLRDQIRAAQPGSPDPDTAINNFLCRIWQYWPAQTSPESLFTALENNSAIHKDIYTISDGIEINNFVALLAGT